MIKKLVYLLIGIVFLLSCKSGPKKASGEFGSSDSAVSAEALPVSQEAMGNLVQNISSPVEMAALIKSMGTPFSEKYLSSTKNLSNYNTSFSKAINLGVFGADLGYLNMYKKTSSVMSYITAIKSLAEGINVGQFFDFSTLKRLATNNENIDSLMLISIHSFNVMDEYLRKNNRSNLSALMVTGTYVEGLFITSQVYKERPNKKLSDNIGEQKIIFNELILILKNYQKDPLFANLIDNMEKLKKVYDEVKITIEQGEAESVEKNGMLTIVQHSKSIVVMDDALLKRIIAQTEITRNNIIK
jgi:hypothetical protein